MSRKLINPGSLGDRAFCEGQGGARAAGGGHAAKRSAAQAPSARANVVVGASIAVIAWVGICSVAIAQTPPTTETETIELRRAQTQPLTYQIPPVNPDQIAPPERLAPRVSQAVPDRWRIVDALGVKDQWWDPYNQNTLKGDRPFEPFKHWGNDWFLQLGAISDTLVEFRRLPTPIGAQSTQNSTSNNVFGNENQRVLAQTVIVSASVIKGNTTFKPQDYEFKFVSAFNVNHASVGEVRALNIDPRTGTTRTDHHFGVQELFADVHLRNVSEYYDFDSLRMGIQPFTSDFRGFVFNDSALGVRFFGNRDNNQWQYNLAWLRRLEKDTNSGLNDVGQRLRADDTLVANLYRQDWPVKGHTTQGTVMVNINREGDRADLYDRNGFQVRPAVVGDVRAHNYDVTYFGLNGDGHFGTWNLTSAAYLALGQSTYDPLAQKSQRIEAAFAMAELSRDFDWIRVRATGAYASADTHPYDDRSTGFDAIFENPQIAGADTSFWIRQALPLIGGGGVTLSGRNGLLASLRSSKDQGQSNFANPGLRLLGLGADLDLTPHWRLIGNVSWLEFGNTSSLQALRNQGPIARELGTDISVALQYRPFMTQNIVVQASAAWLQPAQGYRDLFLSDRAPYSVLGNVLLSF